MDVYPNGVQQLLGRLGEFSGRPLRYTSNAQIEQFLAHNSIHPSSVEFGQIEAAFKIEGVNRSIFARLRAEEVRVARGVVEAKADLLEAVRQSLRVRGFSPK